MDFNILYFRNDCFQCCDLSLVKSRVTLPRCNSAVHSSRTPTATSSYMFASVLHVYLFDSIVIVFYSIKFQALFLTIKSLITTLIIHSKKPYRFVFFCLFYFCPFPVFVRANSVASVLETTRPTSASCLQGFCTLMHRFLLSSHCCPIAWSTPE